jgi:hypothetical protein
MSPTFSGENFPEFSPIFLDFSMIKNVIFALYHCILPQKTPRFSGNFPEIFREFSGKIFANFRNLWNFPEISPEIFPNFPTFYKHKKIDLRSVTLTFTEKNPGISGKFSGKISSGNFWHFRNFPRNFPEIFPGFHYVPNNKKSDFSAVTLYFHQKVPGIFREFSGNFPGKVFVHFQNLWNFPEISPKFSYVFMCFILIKR